MDIIKQVAGYCTKLLSLSKCKNLPFHNLIHTQEVVENVLFLCDQLKVNKHERMIVLLAAWFHDTGFSETYKGHEEVSKRIAKEFLSDSKLVVLETIDAVCMCINATKMPQNPSNQLAAILCDADILHISNAHFFYRKLLLRREWELYCDKKVDDLTWHQLNLDFLQTQHFKTSYGKDALEIEKQKNIVKVKNILCYYGV
jgi:HD superfamily phosphodiesterase